MQSASSSSFSNKKTVVSFVLSLLVFFIHFQVFSSFAAADGILKSAFSVLDSLTHVGVPLFFAMSGALFYRNYTLASTTKKWKSRFFSLVIPYLVWNSIWLILALLGQYTPLGSLLGNVKATLSAETLFRGVFLHGMFKPFWFLLQLIVLTALCPLIYLLLKSKWIGASTILALYILYCTGLTRDTVLIPNFGMVVIYLIGAWIGLHHFDWFTAHRNKKQAFGGAIISLICCVYMRTNYLLPEWFPGPQVSLFVLAVSCAALWTAFDFFDFTHAPWFTQNSFLIYAMHSLVGASVSKILCLLLPAGPVYLSLAAGISFFGTVAIICSFGWLLNRYFPRIKRLLTGR